MKVNQLIRSLIELSAASKVKVELNKIDRTLQGKTRNNIEEMTLFKRIVGIILESVLLRSM